MGPNSLKINRIKAIDKAQRLRTQTALAENLSLVPGIYVWQLTIPLTLAPEDSIPSTTYSLKIQNHLRIVHDVQAHPGSDATQIPQSATTFGAVCNVEKVKIKSGCEQCRV